MKPISSHHDLLISITRKGDVSAFCTLLEPLAIAAYRRLRASGLDHRGAVSQLMPLIRILYDRTYTLTHSLPLDVWITAQLGKKKGLLFSSSPLEGTVLVQTEDINRFTNGLNLFISREFSILQHQKRTGNKRRILRILIHQHPIIQWGIYTCGLVLIVCGIAGLSATNYLRKTEQSIIIKCAWHNTQTQVTIKPPHININKSMPVSEPMSNSFTISLNKNNVSNNQIIQDTVIMQKDTIAAVSLPLTKPPVVPVKTVKRTAPPRPAAMPPTPSPTPSSEPPPAIDTTPDP